jgi:hypothetical protein
MPNSRVATPFKNQSVYEAEYKESKLSAQNRPRISNNNDLKVLDHAAVKMK